MTTHGTADSSPGFIDADWPAEAEVVAGCSVRSGGISTGRYASLNLAAHVGDDADAVAANRSRFVAASGLPAEPGWLNQVHGNRVAIAGEAELPEADAVVSPDGNSVIAVLTADCLPILLCSRSSPETAALHCG